jgi:hypothetical protein
MRQVGEQRKVRRERAVARHRWVAAALVDVGSGTDNVRAEHAARTGRHVVRAATRIEVLEVYCANCRLLYGERSYDEPCSRGMVRAG